MFKLGFLFHFVTCDKNLLGMKSARVHGMTVQKYTQSTPFTV